MENNKCIEAIKITSESESKIEDYSAIKKI